MSHAASKLHHMQQALQRRSGKIHARAVDGRFNRLRWAMVWLTQLVFYGTCWLTWESGDTVRQAVWFDLERARFHLFGLVLWPQDGLLLAVLLIVSAVALFLVTTLAGRLFCGFACPQTIYTMMFVWLEARVEGDHLARRRLDLQPWAVGTLCRRLLKHGLWAALALWTGVTFVAYFIPVRELLPALLAQEAGLWTTIWVVGYATFTYVQAGLVREAVCQHMCPYARFQGVMVDSLTLNVSYDAARGEPRTPVRAATPGGACIDCGICVQACPVGIDIREGVQYPCINCGLCVDACDDVMRRIDRPRGLVRFAPETASGAGHRSAWSRPRVLLYGLLLLVGVGAFAALVLQRPALRVDVLRDRTLLARETATGDVENLYLLNVMNLSSDGQQYRISAEGLEGLRLSTPTTVQVAAGEMQIVSVGLTAPVTAVTPGVVPVTFVIESVGESPVTLREPSRFVRP